MKVFKLFLLIVLATLSTNLQAECFKVNQDLRQQLKENNIRLVVLCNFQGANNALNIATSSRSPGYDLTPVGLSDLQSEEAVLKILSISHIYTAPSFRTLQTTNYLGKAFQLTPQQQIVDSRLGMQNFGTAEGINYNDYKELYTSMQEMLESTPPQGESGCSVFNRVESLLKAISENHTNETILLVTHAFNYCHISKCLTGKYQQIPSPGTYKIYEFND